MTTIKQIRNQVYWKVRDQVDWRISDQVHHQVYYHTHWTVDDQANVWLQVHNQINKEIQ